MSFMAATGFIMAESGLEQLWRTIYGSDGVTHMLDGHAYSRALRLHTLTAQAIVTILSETTGARDSIDEPASNQIWLNMTTEEIGVSDAMLKPENYICKQWKIWKKICHLKTSIFFSQWLLHNPPHK